MRMTLCLVMASICLVGPQVGAPVAESLGMQRISDQLAPFGSAHAAIIRRNTIKQSPVTGYRLAVVVDDEADTVASVQVDIRHEAGQPVPLGGTVGCDAKKQCATSFQLLRRGVKPNGNKRYVFSRLNFDSNAAGLAYELTTTMLDSAGKPVGSPSIGVVKVQDDGPSTVRSVSIRQLADTKFSLKVVVVADSEHEVASADVLFTGELDGPAPIPAELSLSGPLAVGGKKTFQMDDLTFEKPALDSIDEVYTVVVDLRSVDGKPLGHVKVPVTVEAADDTDVAALKAELAAANARLAALDAFVSEVHRILDELDKTAAVLQAAIEMTPGDPIANLKAASQSFNVLLHELRGLALEVTLD